jgi:hypothetical protein
MRPPEFSARDRAGIDHTFVVTDADSAAITYTCSVHGEPHSITLTLRYGGPVHGPERDTSADDDPDAATDY